MVLRAFTADYVVLGGGNAKNVKALPVGARLGNNLAAFRGGFRLWENNDWTLAIANGGHIQTTLPKTNAPNFNGPTPPGRETTQAGSAGPAC